MTVWDVLMIIGFIAAIVATQYQKWDDRKTGNRWWEDTHDTKL